ncbi:MULTISPECIES: four-carbon acid sugar kinase family protein [Paracoccus]|uniref:Four-carbon acid sugar kinase family protein n=1 Tax=Paracoccus pantotrophus TaxID=82367 RepID=A0AAE6NW65_PARPN|nr:MULTISPECIES: four-carbon acid sugar kinase family protein [Paracoccus]QFG37579.1 four-carbon acid sugar kinase family protein [Paracoccus pantotrophus]RKS51963.1 uncharacterized protein YgbK (DUF1537 family) [Paracoccus pantotrophus]UFM64108.1 four-carbon acid sugar kinase family protein [Paracoccus sp. MA]SMG50171.1 Uncharacterized conserved protein YgbK, DUF1537 family [Paracoccus sp. J56]
MKLCIIADDLTGALDSAAPFAGRGLAVQVALSPEAVASVAASGAQVMAVSTRSRDGTKDAARKAMAQVVAALPAGVPVLKKIDSRLKGHVAAELAVLDPARMLVAPAIPDFGRITQAGHVGGYGVARPLSIAEALGPLAGRAVIPDVTSATELAAALDRTQPGDLLVGARGLAEALAIRMTGQPAATPVLPRAARSLLVIGSRDPITVEQARQVQASGLAAVLPAPAGEAVPDATAPHLLVQAVAGQATRTGSQVAEALARSVHPRLTAGRQALLLSGGATAEAVLAHMGITSLRLAGECLPGLAVAYGGEISIIAKSGGFGAADTLATLLEMFRGQN